MFVVPVWIVACDAKQRDYFFHPDANYLLDKRHISCMMLDEIMQSTERTVGRGLERKMVAQAARAHVDWKLMRPRKGRDKVWYLEFDILANRDATQRIARW